MKKISMQNGIAGMMIVSSFIFLMGVVGGVQTSTIGIIESFFYILGSFVLFLLGVMLLRPVEEKWNQKF